MCVCVRAFVFLLLRMVEVHRDGSAALSASSLVLVGYLSIAPEFVNYPFVLLDTRSDFPILFLHFHSLYFFQVSISLSQTFT